MESTIPVKRSGFLRIFAFIIACTAFFGAVGYAIFEGRELFLSSAPLWQWGMLFGVLATVVAIDIGSHRGGHEITLKNAIAWSIVWVVVSLGFGAFAASVNQAHPFGEAFSLYTTGWALEKTLALDNLFVMALIFGSFGLMNKDHQPIQLKILYYGIVGMVLMRVLFLSFGSFFINLPSVHVFGLNIEWPMLLFAAIIGWSVLKMGGDDDEEEVDYSQHWSVKATSWIFPINPSVHSRKFFTSRGVTPLLLCLVCIEFVDFMFAFDSMPVIIAVVKDPYLMAASNLMACAGLRSLYFVLLAARNTLWALDTAVKYLLMFIAAKLFLAGFGFHIPALLSLVIVIGFILGGVVYSLAVKNPNPEEDAEEATA